MKQLFTPEELHDFNSSIIKLDFYLDMPSEQQKMKAVEKSAKESISKLKKIYEKCLLLSKK